MSRVVETFYTNPQYRVTVEEPDEDDEDGLSTIIVGLMQKERRKMRADGKSDLTIGQSQLRKNNYKKDQFSMFLIRNIGFVIVVVVVSRLRSLPFGRR